MQAVTKDGQQLVALDSSSEGRGWPAFEAGSSPEGYGTMRTFGPDRAPWFGVGGHVGSGGEIHAYEMERVIRATWPERAGAEEGS